MERSIVRIGLETSRRYESKTKRKSLLSAGAGSDPALCETQRCKFYLENSFNVNTKSYCRHKTHHRTGVLLFERAARRATTVCKGGGESLETQCWIGDVAHGSQSVTAKTESAAWLQRRWHNNEPACRAAGFVWHNVSLSDAVEGLSYPVCAKTQFARINQLGNALDTTVEATSGDDAVPHAVNANRFMWTVPAIPTAKKAGYYADDDLESAYASCALRIRYNISTSDFPAWPEDAMEQSHPWATQMVTSANNSVGPAEADARDTPLYQDPYVYIGAGDEAESGEQFVSLAVNTNQYSRTFQDRSYTFKIKPRPTAASATDLVNDAPSVPATAATAKIYNVNVRGKRGNIVQTFPAVEYDFVPNALALELGDIVHFQWTGSDYNPRRGCNDAEGGPPDANDFQTDADAHSNSRADRSNVVFMNAMSENVPMDMAGYSRGQADALTHAEKTAATREAVLAYTPCAATDAALAQDDDAIAQDAAACAALMRRLAYLDQQQDAGGLQLRDGLACLTEEELDAISSKNQRENHPRNCAKLNARPHPYFDAGMMVLKRAGIFAFFSSSATRRVFDAGLAWFYLEHSRSFFFRESDMYSNSSRTLERYSSLSRTTRANRQAATTTSRTATRRACSASRTQTARAAPSPTARARSRTPTP